MQHQASTFHHLEPGWRVILNFSLWSKTVESMKVFLLVVRVVAELAVNVHNTSQ